MMADSRGREGQRLGNYHLVRLLGHGGFADVYLGEHLYLKTPVAVKLLQANMAGKDDRENFLKEAQTIARLIHPNIIRVMDFGLERKTPFLVMDYAPNGTLHQRYPPGAQLPLATIIPFVMQVAAALHYAHEEKVIHRDIKPENMLVGRHNEVLLSDFGIALVAHNSRYQSTQEILGTAAYMAPEQIQGQPLPASDQYSLGIVVYEWLCGERPFQGSFKELCTQHVSAPPPSLREKGATISPAVEQVVMKALAKDPEQRFATVQAFANALEEVSRAEESQQSEIPSQGTPAPRQSLTPTIIASPAKQGLPQTEKAVPLDTIPPLRTEVAPPPQFLKTPRVSPTYSRPFQKRLESTLLTGGTAGILSALFTIAITLLNAPAFQHANKEVFANKLTVATAFAVIGIQSLNLFVSLLIYFVAGVAVGIFGERRSLGFLAGVIAGVLLYIMSFLVRSIPAYPSTIVGGAGMFTGGPVVSLVFLCTWGIIGGFVSFLGAWLVTRRHPYYVQ